MALNLPDYIEITKNAKDYIGTFLNENSYSSIFVLVDENTRAKCLPLLKSSLTDAIEINIKSGEAQKTLETCTHIWEALTNANADRKALLINLGGGVIGDMGGFCASTYKRGIDFVNIPTTLLSQVDASVGGKLGIDFNGLKNHIGLFKLPAKVIIDSIFLETLPFDQLRSGFAEMLKHGFIQHKSYVEELSKIDLTQTQWLPLITKSIAVKNSIVTTDPLEKDERKYLNFGHTIGHAVETYFLNNNLPILHGEGVALGMIAEAHLAEKLVGFNKEEKEQLVAIIDSYFERIEVPKIGIDEILANLDQDKKNNNTRIEAVLLKNIGQAEHSIKITKQEVKEALEFYNAK